jgi:hypothetical protein
MPDFEALNRYFRRRIPAARWGVLPLAMRCLPVTLLAAREVAPNPCDVLLLQPHASAGPRHVRLAASLAKRGLAVRQEFVPRYVGLLGRQLLSRPTSGWTGVPRMWRAHSGYAAWLVARYQPRVIVTFMDDSLHSPFLREAAAAAGGAVVNVAHCMSGANLDFSMCDFDWYLLWGRRSYENLASAAVRFGSCRTLAIGSIYQECTSADVVREPPAGRPARLLWIGQDLSSEHGELLRRDAAAFGRFLVAHSEYEAVIRPHPRDRGELERAMQEIAPRARWAEAGSLLAGDLGDVDIAVSSFSSGLIDAASAGLPVVAFSSCPLVEAIGLREAGLPVVADEADLEAAVAALLSDYVEASRAALGLAREHLQESGSATERCAEVVEALALGRDPVALGFPEGALRETLP